MREALAAARQVAQARLEGHIQTPLPDTMPLDIQAGYKVMEDANRLLVPELGAIAGYKIGATTLQMRQYLGVSEPVYGVIFQSTVQRSPGQAGLASYRRLGIETEIAVVLGQDLPLQNRSHDRAGIAPVVQSVHAAIELVDDRYGDFRAIGPASLAADNFFGAGLVLGEEVHPDSLEHLDRLAARTILDGSVVATGLSDALLGHPLDALAWFANCLAGLNQVAVRGSVVTLGSITPVFWIDRPMPVRIEIDGLGAVDVRIREA